GVRSRARTGTRRARSRWFSRPDCSLGLHEVENRLEPDELPARLTGLVVEPAQGDGRDSKRSRLQRVLPNVPVSDHPVVDLHLRFVGPPVDGLHGLPALLIGFVVDEQGGPLERAGTALAHKHSSLSVRTRTSWRPAVRCPPGNRAAVLPCAA